MSGAGTHPKHSREAGRKDPPSDYVSLGHYGKGELKTARDMAEEPLVFGKLGDLRPHDRYKDVEKFTPSDMYKHFSGNAGPVGNIDGIVANYWSDEAREAAQEARKAAISARNASHHDKTSTGHGPANRASRKALEETEGGTGNHGAAAGMHFAAAKAHSEAARGSQGQTADAHRNAAEAHRAMGSLHAKEHERLGREASEALGLNVDAILAENFTE
jgi:hypothetical protein